MINKINEINDVDAVKTYNQIKKWLKQGDIQELAKKFKLSRSGAYKALTGKTKHFELVEAAAEMAIERKFKHKALQEKLESI